MLRSNVVITEDVSVIITENSEHVKIRFVFSQEYFSFFPNGKILLSELTNCIVAISSPWLFSYYFLPQVSAQQYTYYEQHHSTHSLKYCLLRTLANVFFNIISKSGNKNSKDMNLLASSSISQLR